MKKSLFTFLGMLVLINLLSFALTPSIVSADIRDDIEYQLEPVGDVYGQDDFDEDSLAETIAYVIQVVLGFLGIIFIILIIYAGFVWMTSAGNEEKISKAKKTLIAAIIGITIVLLAYAITGFVINSLLEATDA